MGRMNGSMNFSKASMNHLIVKNAPKIVYGILKSMQFA